MDADDSASEDEWTSVKKRFTLEGLDWETQDPHSRTLQLWRLLVDAEANLKAARHMNDKLRRQFDEEKVELEEYTEHLRLKCEERVKELDNEVRTLKEDLEALLAGTQAVTSMLLQEGLEDVAHSSLGEQIAYLLVERSTLTEELTVARTKPASDREKELTGQLIKVSTDFELLKRTHQESENQLSEMKDRVSLLEKASRQLEMDNETLAYKLSEALAEIEDNEGQLRRYIRNTNSRRESISQRVHDEYGPASLRSLPFTESSLTRGDSHRRSLRRRESLRNSGRHKKSEPLKAERGKSPRNSGRKQRHGSSRSNSISRDQVEGKDPLPSLDLGGTAGPAGTKSFEVCDTQRSSVRSSASSPRRLHSLLDGQIQSSKHKISMLEEIKQLQSGMEKIRKDLVESGDKYEFIVRKYELYKIKSKNRVTSLRSKYLNEIEDYKRRISHLEGQVNILEDKLRAEDALRKQVEQDLSSVRKERQEMAGRVRESQRRSQDQNQQIRLLKEKIDLIQEANSQLNNKLEELSIAATVG
ncbi:uncharacterized protein [Palaemon carinicauda]|uniref:uncharacterized protein n=1 Tax=Palaemon carinicauda TaxID=392227 RepID=UPI0035B656BF